jgi:hypothetical protein
LRDSRENTPPNDKWDPPNGCWDGDTTIWRATHVVYTGGFSILEFSPPTIVPNDTSPSYPFRWYDDHYNRVSNDAVSMTASIVSGARGSIVLSPVSLGEAFGHTLVYYTARSTLQADGGFNDLGTCDLADRGAAPGATDRCLRRYRFNAWKTSPQAGTVTINGPPVAAPPASSQSRFEIKAGNALEGPSSYQFNVTFPQ